MSTLLLPSTPELEFGPELSRDFFGSFEAHNPQLMNANLHDLGEMIVGAVSATLPSYSVFNSPVEALREGHHSVHCAGRSALAHSLASPLLRFNSHIVELRWGPESSHFFNLILDTEEDEAIIIENWVDEIGIHGLVELVTNPDDVTIVDPLLHAPVYHEAIQKVKQLAAFGNLAGKACFQIDRYFETGTSEDDGNADGRLVHILSQDLRADEQALHNLGLEHISTSDVIVYDPIASDDIADWLGYGDNQAA